MKFFLKTIYLISTLIVLLLNSTQAFSKSTKFEYSQDEIFNYFSGVVSLSQNNNSESFKYLSKMQTLGKIHSNYNTQFISSLILLNKFDEAFVFSKKVWDQDELFFEADLLLGLEFYIQKDYQNAKKHFDRLNKIDKYDFLFEDFFGNILNSWIKASENNKQQSFEFLNKVPERFKNIKLIQESFLNCYFDSPMTAISFEKIITNEDYSFSRYNFFLANYLLHKNEKTAAEIFINKAGSSYDSNLLIKQTLDFFKKNKLKKITNFFNCKEPKDSIAEIFYVIANMYSTQKDYKLSNFYLNISLFLNNEFTPNKTLLAENYYFQKKYDLSKKVYNSIKDIGSIYSWFASKSISTILQYTEDAKKSISYLKNEFKSLSNLNSEHYYEMANFYRDNEYYEESIKYYSLALENSKKENYLLPKILERRGVSYERTNDWKKAEKDLLKSLEMSPDQPYVLNYLGYTWVEKKININKALGMLKKAVSLQKNDGYIIDSLGWAYYRSKNYIEAEKFLQKAVQLKPLDPIISDHYADVLWMLKKDIQARYFWKHALTSENIESDIREKINQKLIFGINNKS